MHGLWRHFPWKSNWLPLNYRLATGIFRVGAIILSLLALVALLTSIKGIKTTVTFSRFKLTRLEAGDKINFRLHIIVIIIIITSSQHLMNGRAWQLNSSPETSRFFLSGHMLYEKSVPWLIDAATTVSLSLFFFLFTHLWWKYRRYFLRKRPNSTN